MLIRDILRTILWKNTRKVDSSHFLYILLVLLVPTIISTQFHVVLGSLGATSFMLLAGADRINSANQ